MISRLRTSTRERHWHSSKYCTCSVGTSRDVTCGIGIGIANPRNTYFAQVPNRFAVVVAVALPP